VFARGADFRNLSMLRLLLFIAVVLVMSGCPDPARPAAVTPPSASGATVDFSAPAELKLAEHWQLQLEEWSAATRGQVHLHETQTAADRPPTRPDATLAVVPLREIPDLIAADWLSPLDDSEVAERDWDDVLRGLRNGISQPGGDPQLIPVACPVLACYYRADLLEAAGRHPPQTWEQYQTLLEELPAWSNGLPAFEPWAPEFRSTLFLARAACSALHPDNVSILLDLQSGEPQIGMPPFVQTLDEGLAALKHLDPQSLQSGPADCARAVLEGRAALAIGTPPLTGVEIARDPNTVIGTVRLPGATRVFEPTSQAWTPTPDGAPSRVTVVGFGGFAVCSSRAASAEARTAGWGLWDSLQRNSDEDDLPFGPAVCRQRDVPAALQRAQAGFNATEWRQHVTATVGALQETRVLLDLPLPEPVRFRELLTVRLTEAIEGAPAATALEQAAVDWKALITELDEQRVLNVYRQCHGLSPL